MIALSIFAFAALATTQPQIQPTFPEAWDQVVREIRSGYYARNSKKEEMEAAFGKFAAQAKAAKSMREFSDTVNSMIAELKDSHFALLTKEDQGYFNFESLVSQSATKMPNIGAWFKKTAEGYTVQMVLNDAPADKAGLRKGDLIVSIDGNPFAPIASLADKVGKQPTLKVRRGSKEFQTNIAVSEDEVGEWWVDASRRSAKVIDRSGKHIGYFHLWTCSSEPMKNALAGAVYGSLKKTDAFVLDLRDGFGGRPEGYADPFFRPEATIVWKIGNVSNEQLFGYGRPLVVIINEGSRSAKEVLSYILKKSGRATLVGSRTAGHVLGTTPSRLNAWAFLEIPRVEVIVDGESLEGKGVAPDIEVPREFDDSGKDLYLEKALEVAAQKAAAGR